jgi:uncharacterized protein
MESESDMVEGSIKFCGGDVNLEPAPINPNWILEGDPVTRSRLVSSSADGNASTWLWDCTAGKFNWFYAIDETVYVIEGSVSIKEHGCGIRDLKAGDSVFFPAGSSAEWNVPRYVRKVAFLRAPLPRPLQIARRIYRSFKGLVGGGNGNRDSTSPAMFQNR